MIRESHEEIYRELSLKYNISLDSVRGILKFMVKRTIDEMESKNFREIMWPHWGKFCVSKTKKRNYECYLAYIKEYGAREKGDYRNWRSFKEHYISEQKHKENSKSKIK